MSQSFERKGVGRQVSAAEKEEQEGIVGERGKIESVRGLDTQGKKLGELLRKLKLAQR